MVRCENCNRRAGVKNDLDEGITLERETVIIIELKRPLTGVGDTAEGTSLKKSLVQETSGQ